MNVKISSTKLVVFIFLINSFLLVSCTNKTEETLNISTQEISDVKAVGYTYHSADGNRLVEGVGGLNAITPIDIPLPSSAIWLASVASQQSSYWVAVLSDGNVKAFKVTGQAYEEVAISPSQLGLPIPPTLVLQNDNTLKLGNVFDDGSTSTSAVILNALGDRVYIDTNGNLVYLSNESNSADAKKDASNVLEINALPYARILMDEQQRLLVLTNPSTAYAHRAVLGNDYVHAAAITLVQTTPSFKVLRTINIDSPDVVEGNALIWRDVDGDGTREIITTLSRTDEGGRMVVFNEDGTQRNATTSIGVNFRWRHQVAVAPFVSADEEDLVAVHIPHITPKIESFRLDDNSMDEVTLRVNYSSHLFTGINIDMGIMGDFDNDSKIELLLIESGNRQSIAAFEYDNGVIAEDWVLPLVGSVSSNVAAATLADKKIAYGVGQGASLRIWHP